jgi:hypothetical protein
MKSYELTEHECSYLSQDDNLKYCQAIYYCNSNDKDDQEKGYNLLIQLGWVKTTLTDNSMYLTKPKLIK